MTAGGPLAGAALFEAVFRPRGIALIGASGDPKKNTARPQRFLRKHGYDGAVYPINRTRSEILGERAYPTLAAVGQPVDQAFIMVPTEDVADAIEACGACGVPVATIFSDGFAESGPDGAAAQAALASRARALGVRLLGPNCIGLINVTDRVVLSVNAVLEMDHLVKGGLAIVSQSGSVMGALLARGVARGIGCSKLVSVGNESDVAVGEMVDVLVDDPHTTTIALFLETLRDADALARAARRAHAAGKPVIAYKLGRSAVGEALAVSHTGALAGADAAVDAFFRTHGILRVDMMETLLEIGPLVSPAAAAPRSTQGPGRVAVVTTTGGGAAMVADQLGVRGCVTATPDDALVARLADRVAIRKTPIIDLTLTATADKYAAVLDALDDWDGCDAVLAVVGSSAQFHPQLAVKPIVTAKRAHKPFAAFLAPAADQSLALLTEARIAGFRTPEACADALAAVLGRTAPRALPTDAGPDLAPALAGCSGTLNERDALALFAACGIPTAQTSVAHAPVYRHDVPYPVVAKVLSRDVPHKTDAGGVVVGIADDDVLREAVGRILGNVHRAQPGAHIEGVLVQRMERGVGEVLVGYRHDPLVGPIVVVGAGGTRAELDRDVAVNIAPVDADTARAMIARVRSLGALAGWRGGPAGDVEALVAAIVALSRLAIAPGQPIAEAEVNPLIVRETGAGVVAVDGLVVLRAPDA